MANPLVEAAIKMGAPKAGANPLVQGALAIGTDVSLKERAMLGLIKEDPELQVRFLQRQGHDAQVVNGEAKINRNGKFESYNPEGLDFGDVLEWAPEIVEGVAGVLATGAKILGTAGGPVGLGIASVAGGATTAAAEFGKQSLAKGLGLRDDINEKRVIRQGLIGAAVPGAGKLIGKTVKFLGGGGSATRAAGEVAERTVDPTAITAAGRAGRREPTGRVFDPFARRTTRPGLADAVERQTPEEFVSTLGENPTIKKLIEKLDTPGAKLALAAAPLDMKVLIKGLKLVVSPKERAKTKDFISGESFTKWMNVIADKSESQMKKFLSGSQTPERAAAFLCISSVKEKINAPD